MDLGPPPVLNDEDFDFVYPESPNEEGPAYMARINSRALSIVQFVQLLATLDLDGGDRDARDAHFTLLNLAVRFNVGPYESPDLDYERLSYDLKTGIEMIPLFVVSQRRDLERQRHKELLVEVCNLVYGPNIAVQENIGFGLVAEKDYVVGETICLYGGVKCSQDPNTALLRGYELGRYGRRYALSLRLKGEPDPTPGEDWIIDGEIFFALSEKGRWANTVLQDGDENASFAVGPSQEPMPHPVFRFINLQAVKPIRAGEWIMVNYGDAYPEEFFQPPPLAPFPQEEEEEEEEEGQRGGRKARRGEGTPFVPPESKGDDWEKRDRGNNDDPPPGGKRSFMASCITCRAPFDEGEIIYKCGDCAVRFCSLEHAGEHNCIE